MEQSEEIATIVIEDEAGLVDTQPSLIKANEEPATVVILPKCIESESFADSGEQKMNEQDDDTLYLSSLIERLSISSNHTPNDGNVSLRENRDFDSDETIVNLLENEITSTPHNSSNALGEDQIDCIRNSTSDVIYPITQLNEATPEEIDMNKTLNQFMNQKLDPLVSTVGPDTLNHLEEPSKIDSTVVIGIENQQEAITQKISYLDEIEFKENLYQSVVVLDEAKAKLVLVPEKRQQRIPLQPLQLQNTIEPITDHNTITEEKVTIQYDFSCFSDSPPKRFNKVRSSILELFDPLSNSKSKWTERNVETKQQNQTLTSSNKESQRLIDMFETREPAMKAAVLLPEKTVLEPQIEQPQRNELNLNPFKKAPRVRKSILELFDPFTKVRKKWMEAVLEDAEMIPQPESSSQESNRLLDVSGSNVPSITESQIQQMREELRKKDEVVFLLEEKLRKLQDHESSVLQTLEQKIRNLQANEVKLLRDNQRLKECSENCKKKLENLQGEHICVNANLITLELAFSDILAKNKHNRDIIYEYKYIENALREREMILSERAFKVDEQYNRLRNEANLQIEKANMDWIKVHEQHRFQIDELNTIIRQLHKQVDSLQRKVLKISHA